MPRHEIFLSFVKNVEIKLFLDLDLRIFDGPLMNPAFVKCNVKRSPLPRPLNPKLNMETEQGYLLPP